MVLGPNRRVTLCRLSSAGERQGHFSSGGRRPAFSTGGWLAAPLSITQPRAQRGQSGSRGVPVRDGSDMIFHLIWLHQLDSVPKGSRAYRSVGTQESRDQRRPRTRPARVAPAKSPHRPLVARGDAVYPARRSRPHSAPAAGRTRTRRLKGAETQIRILRTPLGSTPRGPVVPLHRAPSSPRARAWLTIRRDVEEHRDRVQEAPLPLGTVQSPADRDLHVLPGE